MKKKIVFVFIIFIMTFTFSGCCLFGIGNCIIDDSSVLEPEDEISLDQNQTNQNQVDTDPLAPANIQAKLTSAGYKYYNMDASGQPKDCREAGITDLATCYAYSQVGYKVSNEGTPKSSGYASSSGWCCKFVKWAYSMAGKTLSDCYTNDTRKESEVVDGDRVVYGTAHVALVYKDAAGVIYEIDGNWGVSNGYKNTYVTLQKVSTADNFFNANEKYLKK